MRRCSVAEWESTVRAKKKLTTSRQAQCVSDAQKSIKGGDSVIFTDDAGYMHFTAARCDAYQVQAGMSNAGMWVVFLTGRAGYWDLSRVRPNPSAKMGKRVEK